MFFSGLVAESMPLRGVPVDFRAACVPKILRLENFQAVLIPSSGINLCERRCAKTAILVRHSGFVYFFFSSSINKVRKKNKERQFFKSLLHLLGNNRRGMLAKNADSFQV